MYIIPANAIPMDMTHLAKGEWRNFLFPECGSENADLLVLTTKEDYPAIKLSLTPPIIPQPEPEMESEYGDPDIENAFTDHIGSLWAE